MGSAVTRESLSGAVHFEPVEQWISTQPVAGLGCGDPLAPGGAICWIGVAHLTSIARRD